MGPSLAEQSLWMSTHWSLLPCPNLIAYQRTVDEIRELVGADSLHYLSVDGMMRALKRTDGFCQACFTGQYPIPVDLSNVKTGFERVTK